MKSASDAGKSLPEGFFKIDRGCCAKGENEGWPGAVSAVTFGGVIGVRPRGACG